MQDLYLKLCHANRQEICVPVRNAICGQSEASFHISMIILFFSSPFFVSITTHFLCSH